MTHLKRPIIRYFILSAGMIAFFSILAFTLVHDRLLHDIDGALVGMAEEISQSASLSSLFLPENAPKTRSGNNGATMPLFSSDVYVQIWRWKDNKPLIQSTSTNLATVTNSLDAASLENNTEQYQTVILDDKSLRVYTQPIIVDDTQVASLQIANDLTTMQATLDWLQQTLLLIYLVLIAFLGGISLWFSNKQRKPIQEIIQAASEIATTNDLKIRLDWNGSEQEVGKLAQVFNQMMMRIDHLFSLQHRFLEDISHELRTPLTAIKGNVEIARRYGLDMVSIEAIEAESIRLARLVEDMLLLARADSGYMHIDMYPLDLDKVVLAVVDTCMTTAQNRHLTINISQCEPVCINGNIDRIKELVTHLVNNAIKFTPDNGQITVDLQKTKTQAVLRVTDTGMGIAAENLPRIFDRFFQVDPARTHTGGSSGLGLPISRWIVEAHAGTITANSKPGKGAVFTITLPRHNPPTEASVDEARLDNGTKQQSKINRGNNNQLRIIREVPAPPAAP